MLATFLIGTLQNVYVTGTFAETKKMLQGRLVRMDDARIGGARGLFGLDFVVLLYPFWHGTYFPTTQVKLVIHATTVYLKEVKGFARPIDGDGVQTIQEEVIISPRVPVRIDVTILFRLAPGLRKFIQTINVLSRKEHDLARETEVHDNLWRVHEDNNEQYAYPSLRLAQIVLNDVVETTLQSVRSIASERYTWKQVNRREGAGGENMIYDIVGEIPRFRCEVLKDLAQPASVFCQAGILQPFDQVNRETDVLGPAVLSFDLRVERVVPEDPALIEALSAPMTADLRADADRLLGRGEGERLKWKSRESGVPVEEILQAEVMQGIPNLSVYGAGDGVLDLARQFFGKKS